MVYAREFLDLGASFPEIDEGKVERIDDAAHMDVAIGKFYPRVRPIGVGLPREETTFTPYLERASTLMKKALLDSDVFIGRTFRDRLYYLQLCNIVLHSFRTGPTSTVLRPPTKTTKPGLNCQRKDV